MIVRDWREVGPDVMHALYACEVRQWRGALAWETHDNWTAVEHARTTWGLPGLVALDAAGRVRGWTFYIEEEGALKVGGFVADAPATTRALGGALIDAMRSRRAERCSVFVYERAPGLDAELAALGFAVERFPYLSSPAPRESESPIECLATEPWTPDCVPAAASLLSKAYAGAGVHFAPNDRPAEWRRYVENLVTHTGVGVLMPDASRVLRRGSAIDGLVLVTRLSETTAHLAQVAVSPSRRRQGLALGLVDEACRRAAAHGCTLVTLLVASSNQAARTLYDRVGFRARACFVAALLTPNS